MRCVRLSRLPAHAGLICIVCLALQATEPEKPIETTVCELVARCKKFDGKRVQFRASVSSDWFEHTALVDSQCSGGVVPRTSDETDKRPDVDAFNRAMDEGKPGNTDLHISAVFTGRFVCKAASKYPKDRRVIEIDQVDALDVNRTKPATR